MGQIKNSKRFAEMERLMGDYFSCHIVPVMQQTKDYLLGKQADELRSYSTSFAGILSSLASADKPTIDPYQRVRMTGEWNTKTVEDYIQMCKKSMLSNKDMQKDFALMAREWRTAVIGEVGRQRYDTLSNQLGCDLAYAYVDYRIEQQMIDKLVKDKMPKSSAEYIVRKAAQGSLFGLEQELSKSPLAAEIERKGEAAYKPTKVEKAAGWAAGAAVDAATLGGVGSWGAFLKLAGINVAFSAATSALEGKGAKVKTVEDCISQGVFGSQTNVFNGFRTTAKSIQNADNQFICSTNNQLKKKVPTIKLPLMDWTKPAWQTNNNNNGGMTTSWGTTLNLPKTTRDEKYKDVPMIVAPGQEENYLRFQEEQKKTKATKPAEPTTQETQGNQETQEKPEEQPTEQQTQQTTEAERTNSNGWGGLLSAVGLSGFSDITKNMGYVLAMLPDIIVGLFTGKTKSLNLQDNLLPIASIVGGMFVKNPILKMLMIGLGGANLINKAGHEALERSNASSLGVANGTSATVSSAQGRVHYRQYPEEPLNSRIENPQLRGNCLIATIDKTPCTITLSDKVVDAYQQGALPLSTLANAVLARNDQMRQMAQENYEVAQGENIHRTRGIQ